MLLSMNIVSLVAIVTQMFVKRLHPIFLDSTLLFETIVHKYLCNEYIEKIRKIEMMYSFVE